MKLVRFGPPGREKPGIIDKDGHIRNLSKVVPDITGETDRNQAARRRTCDKPGQRCREPLGRKRPQKV